MYSYEHKWAQNMTKDGKNILFQKQCHRIERTLSFKIASYRVLETESVSLGGYFGGGVFASLQFDRSTR
jgi:hypothetical protein